MGSRPKGARELERRQTERIRPTSRLEGREDRGGNRARRPPLIAYLDTTSLVKIYVEEKGSDRVRRLIGAALLVSTSVVAYAEARAAFARLRREAGMTRSEYEQAKTDLEQDWQTFLTLDVTEAVYRSAGDLAEKHRLRGFDSLHLASYLLLRRESLGEPTEFSSFDDALNRAARREAG